MSMTESPLDVVVRFSTSNPDLVLNIKKPGTTSNLSLKLRIRSQLEHPASTARLRLIHSGKVLVDNAALGKSVTITRPPPADDGEGRIAKAKGKQPIRDVVQPAARVYIHCSVGDALSAAELSEEAKSAQDSDLALESHTTPVTSTTEQASGQGDVSTTPAPRGFDRLLSAGFTASEVASLRAQFLAIQAHTHTPDTMPTGADLLALEERWLDNTSGTAAAGGDGDTGGFGAEDAGGLEDMLWGNILGFFWPIGAMCWLMREEGVWSRRRQIAVLSGFLVNLTFGFLRVMN